MISVRHAPHRATSNNIRGFREIKNSTHSNRLFTGLGGPKQLTVRTLRPKFDGFSFAGFDLGGGYLESKWLGQRVDNIATGIFEKLKSGGVLTGFLGSLLMSAYRPLRFGIINKLMILLYQIVIKLLTAIYDFIWRILLVPLIIVAAVLVVFLLVDFGAIFAWIGQTMNGAFNFFAGIFSAVTTW